MTLNTLTKIARLVGKKITELRRIGVMVVVDHNTGPRKFACKFMFKKFVFSLLLVIHKAFIVGRQQPDLGKILLKCILSIRYKILFKYKYLEYIPSKGSHTYR